MFCDEDVQQALNDARSYAHAGEYAKALERHVWFHENALIYAPSYSAVRMSFGIGAWVELGRSYPGALNKLREVRDQTLQTYRQSLTDRRLFGEVMTLDFALEDWEAAKALFYEGRTLGVEDGMMLHRLELIVKLGELEWARDIIGDAKETFAEMKYLWQMIKLGSKRHPAPNIPGFSPNDRFARQLAELIQAVAKVNGIEEAKELQVAALKTLKRKEIREALSGFSSS